MGYAYSVHNQAWPVYNPELAAEDSVELGIQINGKIKDRIAVAVDTPEDEIRQLVLARPSVQEAIQGKEVQKLIVVPGRIVNLVVR